MPHSETQEMIRRVEARTGYSVTVDTVSGIFEHARMFSARPGRPAHLIQVSDRFAAFADTIVAAQCGMLLVLWSDPTRVPGFGHLNEKCAYLAGKHAKAPQLAGLEPQAAMNAARHFVTGLLNQLNSTPLEIRVMNLCHADCPGLRGMQAELMNQHLRTMSEFFSPKHRDLIPPEIFRSSAVMNAALALGWSELSGSTLGLLPYESTGHLETGRRLLSLLGDSGAADSASHIRTVDAWANELSLAGLYQWEFTDRTQ